MGVGLPTSRDIS